MEVLKSFNVKETSANFYEVYIPAMRPKNPDVQPKALDKEIHNTFQQQREQPAATRQQVAKGA
jgi:hypothetical protein